MLSRQKAIIISPRRSFHTAGSCVPACHMPRRPVRPGCDPTREGRMRLFGRSAPRRPAARLCVAPLSGRCERFRTFSKPIARSATCLADYSVDRGLGRRMVLVARRRNPPDAFLRYDTHAALIARGGAGKRQARGGNKTTARMPLTGRWGCRP